MNFSLRVASDCISKISDINRDIEEDGSLYNFKEFSVIPSSGLIPAQSRVKLLVEFIPHFIKKYETALVLDIEDIGLTDFFNLPITARSSVPHITVATPTIDLGRCFIHHSYECIVQLSNDTSLKARYELIPSDELDPIKFIGMNQSDVSKFHSFSIYFQIFK